MDIADGYTIRNRLVGTVQAFKELDVLTGIYRDQRVHVIGIHSLPLTAQQRTGVKNVANGIATKITNTLNNATLPTGKTGVVDVEEVARAEQQPVLAFQALVQYAEQVTKVLPEPTIQDDGTATGVIDDKIAQAIANDLATLAAGLTIFLGVLTVRLA